MSHRRPEPPRPVIDVVSKDPECLLPPVPADGPAGREPVTPGDSPEDPDRLVADRERLQLRDRLIRLIARQIAIDFRREHATTPGKEQEN
jgi:hypothetical protein